MSTLRVNEISPASGTTLTIGGSGLTVDLSLGTTTLPSNVVTTDGTQTLTNKTIGVSQLSGTIGVSQGGTGLTALGSANQYLKVNSGGDGLEYGTVDLTNLDADNLTSGTVDIARLPTITVAKGGTGLTSLGTANQVLAVNSGATALEYQTIDLTNLNADNLTSGTVSLTRLPTITTAKGGTGLTAVGSAGQVLRVATNGTDLEYHTLASVEGGAIASFTIADDSSTVINVADGSELQIAGGGSVTTTAVEGNVLTITVDDDLSNYDNTTSGFITSSSTSTLTNKTFDANGTGNSISNIEVADLASGVLDTDLSSVSASDDTLASAKAIKNYVDTSTAFSIMDDSSTQEDVTIGTMISILGGTNINTSVSGSEVTINLDTDINVGSLQIDGGLLELDGTTITGQTQINLSTNNGANDGAVVINASYVMPTAKGDGLYDFLVLDDVSAGTTSFLDASTIGLVTATSVNTFQGKTFNLGVGYTNSMSFDRTSIDNSLQSDTFVFGFQNKTIYNKTIPISGSNNNDITGLTASRVAVSSVSGVLTAGGAIPTGDFVGTSDTQTLTNKTIDYNSNTITNLPNSAVTVIAEDSTSFESNTISIVGDESFGVDTTVENGKLKISLSSSRIDAGGVSIASGGISADTGSLNLSGENSSSPVIFSNYYVMPLSSQDGSAGHVLKTDGSGNLDFVSPNSAYTVKTSGGQLDHNTKYLSVRSADNYFYFQSSPSQGDFVEIKDGSRDANSNFLAFSGLINGTNYTGGASNYLFFNESTDNGVHLHFVYVNSTVGWALTRLDNAI